MPTVYEEKRLVFEAETLAQGLPPNYEEKLVQFQQFIIKQRRAHNYPLHLVGNMDESLIQFDMPSNRTVSKIGEKTVKIRTTGNEKNRLTVVLTCTGDGSKLKTLVIFKRKTMPKIGNKHGVVVAVQDRVVIRLKSRRLIVNK